MTPWRSTDDNTNVIMHKRLSRVKKSSPPSVDHSWTLKNEICCKGHHSARHFALWHYYLFKTLGLSITISLIYIIYKSHIRLDVDLFTSLLAGVEPRDLSLYDAAWWSRVKVCMPYTKIDIISLSMMFGSHSQHRICLWAKAEVELATRCALIVKFIKMTQI